MNLKIGFHHRKWVSATCKKEEQELGNEGRLGEDVDSLRSPNSADSSINVSIYHSKQCKHSAIEREEYSGYRNWSSFREIWKWSQPDSCRETHASQLTTCLVVVMLPGVLTSPATFAVIYCLLICSRIFYFGPLFLRLKLGRSPFFFYFFLF